MALFTKDFQIPYFMMPNITPRDFMVDGQLGNVGFPAPATNSSERIKNELPFFWRNFPRTTPAFFAAQKVVMIFAGFSKHWVFVSEFTFGKFFPVPIRPFTFPVFYNFLVFIYSLTRSAFSFFISKPLRGHGIPANSYLYSKLGQDFFKPAGIVNSKFFHDETIGPKFINIPFLQLFGRYVHE